MVKKGYYENKCFGLIQDRIEVHKTNLFIATRVLPFDLFRSIKEGFNVTNIG